MNSLEAFRKLGVGARFDLKRFHADAEKIQLIPPKKSKVVEAQDVEASTSAPEFVEAQTEKENSGKKKKKPKSAKTGALIKQEEINAFRNANRIHVSGSDIPNPIGSFEDMTNQYDVPVKLLKNIAALGYGQPTPVQMQSLPIMIHRRELLASAPTGSGKTAAFLIPLFCHLKKPQKSGIRALILEPTRELAIQTFCECTRLSEGLGIRCHVIRNSKKDKQQLGSGKRIDVLVSTPNRLVFLLKQEPCPINLNNLEWMIVDESDKLFEAGQRGFRDQLGAIYQACSEAKDVRKAFFSATFSPEVEEWCQLNLDNVISLWIGHRNAAVASIRQRLVYVGSEHGKLVELRNMIVKGQLTPPVLIFVQSRDRAKQLAAELLYDGINVEVIHAERSQTQRENVVKNFRAGRIWVLICTELVGRGIDFKGVNLVINYDFPPSSISYIHRIGRTGRAGRSGEAVTFFTEQDGLLLRNIANVMKEAGCPVPDYMLQLPKPSKRSKRKLSRQAPSRDQISTQVRARKNFSKRKSTDSKAD